MVRISSLESVFQMAHFARHGQVNDVLKNGMPYGYKAVQGVCNLLAVWFFHRYIFCESGRSLHLQK